MGIMEDESTTVDALLTEGKWKKKINISNEDKSDESKTIRKWLKCIN